MRRQRSQIDARKFGLKLSVTLNSQYSMLNVQCLDPAIAYHIGFGVEQGALNIEHFF